MPYSKLEDEHVVEVRHDYRAGYDIAWISEKYNISPRTARRIVKGETYSHLPDVVEDVDSSRLATAMVEEILEDLKKPNYRGRDAEIRRRWGISYEMLKRYKRMLEERK